MALWGRFVRDWNATLLRSPQTVVSTFLASQSTTWVCLYGGLSSLPSGIMAPELAVGWMASRLTRKFRQPLNLALAAAIVRVVPAVSELKVTPLITGVVPDKQAREQAAKARAKVVAALPFMDGVFRRGQAGLEWLNGPVDRFGLAFYLAGKVTSLSTLLATTAVVRQGVDVVGVLAGWGLTGDFSDALANLAGSGAMNAAFTPAHFGLAVYGTQAQEAAAAALVAAQRTPTATSPPAAPQTFDAARSPLETAAAAVAASREAAGGAGRKAGEGEEGGHEEFEFDEKSVLGGMSMVLLAWTLMVTFFAMNEMKRTSVAPAPALDSIDSKDGGLAVESSSDTATSSDGNSDVSAVAAGGFGAFEEARVSVRDGDAR